MTSNPSPLTVNPHIYKKGKMLEFKRLNEGVDRSQRSYTFSGKIGNNSLNTIVSATNNLNQITGRCLLGIYNLLSYFGLSKDPSEKLSKTQSIFDKFSLFFERRSENECDLLKVVKELLVKQNLRIESLEAKIDHLNKREGKSVSEAEVLNLTSKFKEIENYLKKILG